MMTEETLRAALPWAVEWPSRGLTCTWYGGEPLLNLALMKSAMPEWEAAFFRADKELGWSVTTNGTLLNSDAREVLDRHKVSILLSLDGPPELHNQSRVYYGGKKPSFEDIPTADIIAWRPKIEIAWQLDPKYDFQPRHVEEMIDRGFHHINFNLNWLAEWPAERRIALEEFMRYIMRTALQTRRGERKGRELFSNWPGKFDEALIKLAKPAQPCGTGLHMLALTPEGWLYPSQEMAFTSLEPNRAPGTAEYYRVGDIRQVPVIDQEKLRVVSGIKNEQMVTPPGFSCSNCIANPISFGGCHCRYIGQDGADPANRFNIMPGWCQSMQSAMTGLAQGALIEKYVGIKLKPVTEPAPLKFVPRKFEEPAFEELKFDTGRQEFVAKT
jgi:uncharacterized protein